MKTFLVFLALLAFSSIGYAVNDLLILHCEGGASLTFCHANFDTNPFYDSVDYIDGYLVVVPLTTLQNYDCVLTWNNYQYITGQGDILADYVDTGGKVVLLGWGISQCYGRIIDDATYCPIIGGANAHINVNLGTTYPPHDILDGVTTITGIYYRVDAAMESGATRIADDTTGQPLCAINAAETVAAINMVAGDYISWSGDGWLLMNNAVEYLMGSVSLERDSWGAIKASF